MRALSVQEARAQLGDLVIAAHHGETIVITRYGKQVAMLVPLFAPPVRHPPCQWCGQVLEQRDGGWAVRYRGSHNCPNSHSPGGRHEPPAAPL